MNITRRYYGLYTCRSICIIFVSSLQIKNFKLRHLWLVMPSPVASWLNCRFQYPLSSFLKPSIMGSFQSIILRCAHVKQIITLSAGLVLVIVVEHQADYRITDYLTLPYVLSKALFAVASFTKAMLYGKISCYDVIMWKHRRLTITQTVLPPPKCYCVFRVENIDVSIHNT